MQSTGRGVKKNIRVKKKWRWRRRRRAFLCLGWGGGDGRAFKHWWISCAALPTLCIDHETSTSGDWGNHFSTLTACLCFSEWFLFSQSHPTGRWREQGASLEALGVYSFYLKKRKHHRHQFDRHVRFIFLMASTQVEQKQRINESKEKRF